MSDKSGHPWPEKGDQLFTSDLEWWHNAWLSYPYDDRWEMYIIGFKSAADILVEQIKKNRAAIPDLLVFPIVFLYRQYLELRLKRLIQIGHFFLDRTASYPKTHALDTLWKECKEILQKIELEGLKKEDLEAIDEAIAQFCAVDPTSEGFRYPTGKKGEPLLPTDLKSINLRNLAEVMDKISTLFEGVSTVFDEGLDFLGSE